MRTDEKKQSLKQKWLLFLGLIKLTSNHVFDSLRCIRCFFAQIMEGNMEKGLNYIFNETTKIVILGTFPSEKSRNECYYNNPQNQFWKIMAEIFHESDIASKDIEKSILYNLRYACLLNNGVGLWDVVEKCNIKGSSDKDINKPKYNNFSILKQKCPNLRCIVFNSKNAKKLFDKYLKQETNDNLKSWLLDLTNQGNNILPSTSSANARKTLAEKLQEWKNFITKHI